MRKFRSKFSFANVISVLALFIALGGVGYAAVKLPKSSVGPRQIKPNAVSSPKVRNGSLLAKDFAPGQLPKGDPGTPGTPGANGSDAASLIGGGGDVTDGSAGAISYCPANFNANPIACQNNEFVGFNRFGMLSPNATIIARDLFVRTGNAPGTGNSQTFTLHLQGSDTPLSCTVVDPNTTCDSGASTATIPAGSKIEMKVTNGPGTAPDTLFWFGWRATTP